MNIGTATEVAAKVLADADDHATTKRQNEDGTYPAITREAKEEANLIAQLAMQYLVRRR